LGSDGQVLDENSAVVAVLQMREKPPVSVGERVARLEDHQAIRELVMAYGYLCDDRRWDELLELYTDDIERILAGTLAEKVQGKAALRQLLVAPALPRSGIDNRAPDPDRLARYHLRHLMADDVVRIGDDGVTATAAVAYTLVAADDSDGQYRRGAHEGAYVFDFRKVDGVWKFCRQLVFTNNARNPLFQR
jgi:hypothetical protein